MTTEDLKSGSRALLETCLSIVGGATFILQMISHIAVLSGNEAYDENEATQITVFSAFLLLSLTDGYVHFRVYNHTNYDKDKGERSTVTSTTTQISHSHQSPTISSFDDNRDTGMKLSTDYTDLEASDSNLKKHQHQHQHQHKHKHKHKNETYNLTKLNEFSWLAFICTVSCSIDTACVPSVIMSCLRGLSIMGPLNDEQRWMEVVLSTTATAVSAWNSSRLYVMSKKHLMDEEDGSCPCHDH